MSRLSNRKLNKMLQDAVNRVEVPDVRTSSKKVPIDAVVENNVAKKRMPKAKIAMASFVVCCLIVVCTCVGIFVPRNDSTTPVVNEITYVTIDINPSFTIKLINGKVADISSNNKDAGIVLAGIDKENELVGKTFDKAINRVLEESAITGFIDYSSEEAQKSRNAVIIGVMDKNGNVVENIANEVEGAVKSFFKNNNLYAFVTHNIVDKQANDNSINTYGVTLSKYELIKNVYRVENKKVLVIEGLDTEFAKFVEANKNERVSDLYNRLLVKESNFVEEIYNKIHDVIANKVDFDNYVASVDKINVELDNFISNQIEAIKEQGLEAYFKQCDELCKQNLDEILQENKDKLDIKETIREVIKDIKISSNQNKEEIIEELIYLIDWIDSLKNDKVLKI